MKTLYTVLMLCACCYAHAQTFSLHQPTVYVEAYGHSLNSVTINLEKVFRGNHRTKWGYRVGVGGFTPFTKTFVVPVNVFGFTGFRNSHFEFGAGLSYTRANFDVVNANTGEVMDYNSSLHAPVHVAYRFQKPTGGLFFKLGVSNSIRLAEFSTYERDSPVYSTICLALGYTFSR